MFKINKAYLNKFKCPAKVQTVNPVADVCLLTFNIKVPSSHHIVMDREQRDSHRVVPSVNTSVYTLQQGHATVYFLWIVNNLYFLSVPKFLISKTLMGIRMLELQRLICPRLASNSLYNWKWPSTSDNPSSRSQMLGLQVDPHFQIMLCWGWNPRLLVMLEKHSTELILSSRLEF